MESVQIPRYIDSQLQILFFELDEFVLALGVFGIGVVIKQELPAMIAIYFIVKAFRYFKDGRLDGILLHLEYWHGFLPLNKIAVDGLHRQRVY
jgi:conjugal transfer pilus assembly protein TraL